MKNFLEKIGGWKVAAFAILLILLVVFAPSAYGQSPNSEKVPDEVPTNQVPTNGKWIIANDDTSSGVFEKGSLVTIVLAVIGLVGTLIRESSGRQKNLETLIANQTEAVKTISDAVVQNKHSDELRGQAIMTKLGALETKVDSIDNKIDNLKNNA